MGKKSFLCRHWFADLGQLEQSFSRFNFGRKYLFCIIDVLSSQIFCRAMNKKDAKTIVKTFQEILDSNSGRVCTYLCVDKGTEWTNSLMTEFCEKYEITRSYMTGRHKASLAEGALRLIKNRLMKYCTENKTKRYIRILPDVIKGLNQRWIRSINMRPVDVTPFNQVYKRKKIVNIFHNRLFYF